jgi:type IV secretory pathway VirB10-like protein
LIVFVGGALFAGTGLGSLVSGKKAPATPTVIVAKPTAPVPAPPVVEPVQPSAPTQATTETKQQPEAAAMKPSGPASPGADTTGAPQAEKTDDTAPEAGLWKQPPAAKKPVAPKPHKVAVVDTGDDGASKAAAPKPAIATAKPAAPKPAIATSSPKPPATVKGKKPSKVWVDPFAN